jgi:NAD-dependent SIR2 family protein deacetylase
MDKTQLHETLEQLHGELQQIECVDEADQQTLQKLMADIEKLTQSRDSSQHHLYERLAEGLKEGIEKFEASHPRTTMLMGQVADALAKIGI